MKTGKRVPRNDKLDRDLRFVTANSNPVFSTKADL